MKPYASNGGKPIFNEGMTPIGLIVHLYHDRPQAKTKDQYGKVPDIDEQGIQRAEYKITLAWHKQREAELQEMAQLANKTKEEGWPGSSAPGAFFQLEPFFRDGDNPAHNTENREYLRNRYYMNFKAKAKAAKDPATGNVLYSGAPGLLGPHGPGDLLMPTDIWPGCTARASFIMFCTEYMGKHFISTRLQNIQKYDEGDGTRIGGGQRPSADKQFGALKEGAGGAMQGGMGLGLGGGTQPNPFGTPSGAGSGGLGAPATNPFAMTATSPFNPFAR